MNKGNNTTGQVIDECIPSTINGTGIKEDIQEDITE